MAGAPAVILDHSMTQDQNMLRMAEQEERESVVPQRSHEAALAALDHPPLGLSHSKGKSTPNVYQPL